MWYKPYGQTGHQVSVIGFGGMRFPQPQDPQAMADLVRYAHDRGINYFDTAPIYCDDKSEEIMGRAFQGMPRDSFYCSSKCGSARGDELRQSLERSLRRLGLETIDFYHIWCLLHPRQLQERIEGGAIAAAVQAKEQGLIRHLVVSTHLPGDEIAKVLASGYFEGMTLGYNALNFPFRSEGVAAAQRLGLGVVTMNPLGGGMIPRNAERLAFLMGPGDRSVTEAALRFNVSQPGITVALVGFAERREIDQAVAAVDGFTAYPPAHIDRLKSRVRDSFNGFCTGCGYCLPCPSEVEIPKFMDSYNQSILDGTGILQWLKGHWNLGPADAAACTQCGHCEDSCTQHLPIRDRLAQIAALTEKP
jgi:predicted aldo/keto reductase-like oxidoreductase